LRKIVFLVVATLSVVFSLPLVAVAGDVSVRGYWRDSNHDGIKDTYVAPYHRSSPNNSVKDNYGYPGNYNPNSGSTTTGNPDTYERSHQQENPYGNPYGR